MAALQPSHLPGHLNNLIKTTVRVWFSGSAIGRYQITIYALSLLLFPIDYLLSKLLPNKESKSLVQSAPMLFISGYARSGTTLIYQVLTDVLDVERIDNLLVLFPRSYLRVKFLLRRLGLLRKQDGVSENFFGLTKGLTGANDGGQLYRSWFNDATALWGDMLGSRQVSQIKNFFSTHTSLFENPLVSKNCNSYLMFAELSRLLPNARFLFIRRDPTYIIASTLKSRNFVQGSTERAWEISWAAENIDHPLDPADEIALNIRHSHELMEEFKKTIADNLYMEIDYEDFCRLPKETVKRIASTLLNQDADPEKLSQLQPFAISKGSIEGDTITQARKAASKILLSG